MKNNYYVTDAHCHVYPDAIAVKATAGTDGFYGLHSCYDGTTGTLFNTVRADGVDHFVIQSVATAPKQVSSINRFIAEEVAAHPDVFTGLGTMHPESEHMQKDMEELVSLGLHGVKLHPDIQHFHADTDYLEILEMCEALHLPVLMHTGDYRYDYSNPDRIINVLERFPKLTLVGAHLGGWSVWQEAVEKLAPYPNLYVDSSSSFYSMADKPEEAARIIRRYGVDRVMFATDYPMWSARKEMEYLFSLGFNADELSQILSGNAMRVYGAGAQSAVRSA